MKKPGPPVPPEFLEVAQRTVDDERGVLQALQEHPEPADLEGARRFPIEHRLHITRNRIARFETSLAHWLAREVDPAVVAPRLHQAYIDSYRSTLASLREDEAHLVAGGCADPDCSTCC